MRLITYEQVKDGTSMFNLIEDRDIGSDSLERRLQQNKQTLYRMIEQSLPEGYNYSKNKERMVLDKNEEKSLLAHVNKRECHINVYDKELFKYAESLGQKYEEETGILTIVSLYRK